MLNIYLSEKVAVEYFIVLWNSLFTRIYFITLKLENPQFFKKKIRNIFLKERESYDT